jgi:bifunctional UDP-N-acetylglucosamine pyrophosphorylase/glucosamine-1-phosphate N-acetyltransferase
MTVNKTSNIAAVILAIDPGKRMNSASPTALHPLLGRPLIQNAIEAAQEVTEIKPILVFNQLPEEVRQDLDPYAGNILQESQLDALKATLQDQGEIDYVLVTRAEMPLMTGQTLSNVVAAHQTAITDEKPLALVTILTFATHETSGFDRVIRGENEKIIAVSREAMVSPGKNEPREYDAGVYCFTADWLWQALESASPSPTIGGFLNELIKRAVQDGLPVGSVSIDDPNEALVISTRIDLAEAEAILRQRVNQDLMLNGVTIIDPKTTYIDANIEIGKDSVIWPNTYLHGSTQIGENCAIGPNTILRDTRVGNHCIVLFSVSDGAIIEDKVDIGPFARLRKGAHLAEGVHMGNFGEIKNAYLGSGTKMGHFSYVGDTDVGTQVNIGAGVVVANYDGKRKHQTEIGARAFIGSDTILVAPLKVGEDAQTGAGAVVTKDVPPNTLAVGMPARAIRKKEKDDGP